MEKLTLSPAETAEVLGISRDLVYDLMRSGELRSVKAGARRLVTREAMQEFLTSHTGYEGTAA